MLTSQRRLEILRRLRTTGYVEARQLATELAVDGSTIRRDLDALARSGQLERTHGGAVPASGDAVELAYETKQRERLGQKAAIAAEAAELISDGDAVILDSGSTTYQLARLLQQRSGLTVVTNDLRISKALASDAQLRLLVTGGELLDSVFTLAGERAVAFVGDLNVDSTFLGAEAIEASSGITNTDGIEVPLKRAMLAAAQRRIVLADSTKFGRHALVRVAAVSEVDAILTDAELSTREAGRYGGRVRRVPLERAAMSGVSRSADDAPAAIPAAPGLPASPKRGAQRGMQQRGQQQRKGQMVFLGVDIGTASSKAVLVRDDGTMLRSVGRPHETQSPQQGWYEHDAEDVWWADVRDMIRELLDGTDTDPAAVGAVCVSGIGPCALVTTGEGEPLRPGILYGIDTRATAEIDELTARFGTDTVLERAGNLLTSQSIAPKLAWVAHNEPEVWEHARRWFHASTYAVFQLTGEYVCDHYTASASDLLYDVGARDWWDPAWTETAPGIERPRLAWPGEVVGQVTRQAADRTGLRAGTPVLAGTVDAFAESYSAGCVEVGDTMVMYGSTLFLIQTAAQQTRHPGLWAASGRTPRTYSLAAGMATSGLVTSWLADMADADFGTLVAEADKVPAGSEGLVLLPYFAGERTPLFDPDARGVWLGMTLRHGRGHLYRSVLEGVAYGVRHNLETMSEAGASPRRLVAVGGGTKTSLWAQIVSDVSRLPQDVPSVTIGAAYGDARMAADACDVDTSGWNPVADTVYPDPETGPVYEELYGVYRRTYESLADDMHLLARHG